LAAQSRVTGDLFGFNVGLLEAFVEPEEFIEPFKELCISLSGTSKSASCFHVEKNIRKLEKGKYERENEWGTYIC